MSTRLILLIYINSFIFVAYVSYQIGHSMGAVSTYIRCKKLLKEPEK